MQLVKLAERLPSKAFFDPKSPI